MTEIIDRIRKRDPVTSRFLPYQQKKIRVSIDEDLVNKLNILKKHAQKDGFNISISDLANVIIAQEIDLSPNLDIMQFYKQRILPILQK